MSSPSEFSQEEREALKVVGVDPDATSTALPPVPPKLTLEGIPASWEAVVAHARVDLSPYQIIGFFETPQPDLENDDGSALTPAFWLADGRDAAAVIALIVHL